jgi:opacity protein-like surface antigen
MVSFEKYDDYDLTVNSVTVHHHDDLGNTTYPVESEGRPNSFVAGWTGGLGGEYMLWNNLFMRAEWEYVRFVSAKNINFSTNGVRAGLGYKF